MLACVEHRKIVKNDGNVWHKLLFKEKIIRSAVAENVKIGYGASCVVAGCAPKLIRKCLVYADDMLKFFPVLF